MDPFDTAELRRRVLATWAASPARFREDANAEEELVRGAYRDRVLVELAQNAADAALRAGTSGRLLLCLDGSALIAANTGAPLDAAGVEALSTLRASAKRDDEHSVGRFGVGFASVLAVSDEPAMASSTGGVRWSRSDARAAAADAAAEVPELAAELARRGDAVPVLRLPWPSDAVPVPDGYDTAVVLPLRDAAVVEQVRAALHEVDEALLLTLEALGEVVVDVEGGSRVLRAAPATVLTPAPDAGPLAEPGRSLRQRQVDGRTWRIARRAGIADGDLLAERPTEERARPAWSVSVAVPVVDDAPAAVPASVPRVVHAPTPTDDRSDLPVLVTASFPLDSSRRRVAPGALTDHLVDEAARAFADLVASFDTASVLDLVPGPLGAGELDAAVHRAVLARLASTSFVPSASPDVRARRLRPDEVVLVEGLRAAADPSALAGRVAGLPHPAWWRADVLRRLGARQVALADVVDELAATSLEPAQWREVYAALDGADLEALGALPVPLTDGRLVRGPRGLVIAGEVGASVLDLFGLRVVAPDAVHPLLRRLGAADASAASTLRDPRVARAVEAAREDESGPVSEAVLGLVAAAGAWHDELPWLASVVVPDRSGEFVPAAELMFADAPLLESLDVDADADEYVVSDELVERFGRDVLRALGVRDGLAVVREADVVVDDELWHDLDDEDGWLEDSLDQLPAAEVPPVASEFVAVRDLDLVRPDAWPAVLHLIATDPDARAAVTQPCQVVLDDGTRRAVEPYTAWWLRRHVRIDGHRLDESCAADATPVVQALLRRVDLPVDAAFGAAIGLVRHLEQVDADDLLARLADPTAELAADVVREVYNELSGRDLDRRDLDGRETDGRETDGPGFLRVVTGSSSRVVPAADVVVVDGPHWLQLGLEAVVVGTPELAASLGVATAGDRLGHPGPEADGAVAAVPVVVREVLPEASSTYVEHDDLVVAGRSVDWWVARDATGDVVHAATTDGLAKGLAWVCGRWDRRWLLAEAMRDPARLAQLLAEDDVTLA